MGLLEDQYLVIRVFMQCFGFFVQGTMVRSCMAASQHRCQNYFCQTDYSSTAFLFLDRHASSSLASSPHFWRTVESCFYRSFPHNGVSFLLPLQQLFLLINRGEGWNLTSNVGWWGKKNYLCGGESRTELIWSEIKLVIHDRNASADIWATCEPAGFSSLQ